MISSPRIGKLWSKIPQDKRLHLIWGFLLSALGLVYWPLASLGLIAGVAKEAKDYYFKTGNPEWLDLIATWIGSFLAISIVYLSHVTLN